MYNNIWTPEVIEKLKNLYAEGIPIRKIGKILDISENAVAGKIRRLGLAARGSPVPRAKVAPARAKQISLRVILNGTKDWDDELTARLKGLYLDKSLSTGEIAKILGVSKNAVCGKVSRMGWNDRGTPIKRIEKAEAKPVVAVRMPKYETSYAADDGSGVLTCCWPLGDKVNGFHYCGARTKRGKSYCLEHCEVAYSGKVADVMRI